MTEFKCPECNKSIAEGVTECPHCGYPVLDAKKEQRTSRKKAQLKRFNIMPFISLFLGIVIIIMGITIKNKDASLDIYLAKNYNIENIEFGGDFYTEIYAASDMIVDELSDINKGVESLSQSIASSTNVIYYSTGMLIIAIGTAVVAISCNNIKRELLCIN